MDRRISGALGVGSILVLVLAGCGNGGGSAGTDAPTVAATAEGGGQPAESEAAAPDGGSGVFTGEDVAGISAVVPAAGVETILGEAPTPECSHNGTFKSDACTWTAADGASSLQVSFSTSDPSLEAWTDSVTTVGVDEPIDGLGEAALGGDNPFGGVRISTFDNGTSVWVTINKEGDRAALMALAVDLATSILEAR